MNKNIAKLLSGKELRNSKPAGMPWDPRFALELTNANGDIATSSMGYQYAISTTTLIRAQVLEQKFYRIAPADFMPMRVGEGAYLEDLRINQVFDIASPFETGFVSNAANAQIASVDAQTAPITVKFYTWAKGYLYTLPEVRKALASNQWDVIASRMSTLKRHWDLGLQEIAFLGLKSNLTDMPGLLTNSTVTVNTSRITGNISGLSSSDFSTLVANMMADYMSNSAATAMPNTFLMPLSDYVGMATPVASGFPVNSKLEYLLNSFKMITGNANFKIAPLAYGDQNRNAGWINSNTGKYRYVLYNNEEGTLGMQIPVDFTLNPAGTANNFQFQGVGVGQFSGCVVFRVPEVLYYDHT